ncbi:MAG: alpha/beta fold hydrolase [Bacteriovoracaceae bacterium]|nr:alpha/beta fold hydrolase [Bacteriovoracaceae bacterium]
MMLKRTMIFCLVVTTVLLTVHSYAFDQLANKNLQFKGKNDVNIVFTKFGTQTGNLGSVVISPGRTESSLKYEELSFDLIKEGFSPVFVINHRGQGLSDRLLKNRHKGHVSDFNHYYHDFNIFIEHVRKDRVTDKNNLFLLAHSMGGAIATGFLQTYGTDQFKGLILSSPMLGINLNGKSETRVLLETLVACKTPLGPECNDYAQDGDYVSEDDTFEGNNNTSSQERFESRKSRWMNMPELQLGGPTIRWVRESIKANIKMRKASKVQLISDLPILLLQAENDVTVSNSKQNQFCLTVNKVGGECSLQLIPNAKHEILMESDQLRNQGIDYIMDFIKD